MLGDYSALVPTSQISLLKRDEYPDVRKIRVGYVNLPVMPEFGVNGLKVQEWGVFCLKPEH